MPAFDGTGFSHTPQLSPGQPCFSIGASNDKQAMGKFLVDHVALTSNVATLTGTIVEGNIPLVGQLISVQGTATGSGEFNVSNVAISAVSITASTGKGTISYALTASNVGSTADQGIALIQPGDTSENIAHASGGYAGQAFALSSFPGFAQQGRSITWSYNWTAAPTSSIAIALEGAVELQDFVNGIQKAIDTGTSTTGETKVVTVPNTVNFLRINVTAISSTSNVLGVAKFIG